ncbi:spore germination protein [Metabacillus idriensis]|uniref:Uncharacterized protein n=1 Tax=Metabacillus idriensis TaxID=324768 RepID=A0A6I2MCP2_9BACI|nr:spore germination protein [Metabacillus idriensis]MCM3596056.1 spore germination protein [Metabacillus idriensis]MRX56020.1 hypothetical protein [Metabacillus idriensis]OHR72628.1 hypothetical protein HMPREF3291_05715 [Bacillus sp. HMSC76G11]
MAEGPIFCIYQIVLLRTVQNTDFDVVFDSSQLHQIITDNSLTPFPFLLSTERIDKTVFALISGQVAVFSNGSAYAVTGPSILYIYKSLFSF